MCGTWLSSCNSQAPECGLIVAHGLSCPTACGMFPEQGSNLCPLHWLTTGPPWKSEIQLGFWMLILYPAILLDLLLVVGLCVCVCVNSIEFSVYKIVSSVNWYNLTSPFLICIILIYFSCLIALAGTLSTMSNRSGKSKHLCFVPDIREKAFSLCVVCIDVSYKFFILFIRLRKLSSIPCFFFF